MGNGRRNEKGKAPAYSYPIFEPTNGGVGFPEGTFGEDDFDSIAGWEDIHQSTAQGGFEPIGNPRFDSVNDNSFRNPQTNLSSNTADTNLQDFSLLPDWNTGWGQQYMNPGHNAIGVGDVSAFGGESSFGAYNRPHVNRDIVSSSSLFSPRDSAPVHTRTRAVQGNFEGSFLSLGLGGTSETVPSSQLKQKEVASNELKTARGQKATGQTFSHVNRLTTTNNVFGSHGSFNSGPGSMPHHILQMQQNDRHQGRTDKVKKAASIDLKMVHARKGAGQSQTLDAGFTGFQTKNYGVGVHRTSHSGSGFSPHHIPQMQQTDSRNMRSGDLDHYKPLMGNQSALSGSTPGGNSVKFVSSQQHNFIPPEFLKPSWMASYHTPSEQLQYARSSISNVPNYSGQVTSQNAMHTQVAGGNLFSQRTAVPQVSWVGSGPAGVDAHFPKRLGVEYDARYGTQNSHRHLSPVGTSLQTTNTASSVDSQSRKFDYHVRRHHKRTAIAPPESSSRRVHRQKITHPPILPSIPFPSYGQPVSHVRGPIDSHIHPIKPSVSNIRSHFPITTPAVSHITWKDPDATPKLSGNKCFLCKRDLALTSEGPAYPHRAPPPVAVLSCGHTFHDECLQKITPDDQAKDPPCIPCAIGEQ